MIRRFVATINFEIVGHFCRLPAQIGLNCIIDSIDEVHVRIIAKDTVKTFYSRHVYSKYLFIAYVLFGNLLQYSIAIYPFVAENSIY